MIIMIMTMVTVMITGLRNNPLAIDAHVQQSAMSVDSRLKHAGARPCRGAVL